MVFIKRNPDYSINSFGFAVLEDGEFHRWLGLFKEAEDLRREILLLQKCSVGASFLTNYTWTNVAAAEAYALSEHICGGYNKFVGNIPSIKDLEYDVRKYKIMLKDMRKDDEYCAQN